MEDEPRTKQQLIGELEDLRQTVSELEGVKEALRESEEHYRDLVENIEDLICTHDLEGNLLFVNKAPARVLGYARTDLVGTNLRSHLAPEKRHLIDEYLAAIQRDGQASGLMVVRTKAGEKRVWEYRNTLRTEGPGAPFVRGLARDITDRKESQEALKRSEANYRALFDSMNDAVFVHDPDTGDILDVNHKMCEMYGYTRDEALRLNVEAISAGQPFYTQGQALNWISKAVQEGPQVFEWLCKDSAGRFFWVEVNLKSASIGGALRILAAVREITDRKRAEEALRSSEERYRLLVDKAPIGICSVDKEGRILEINQKLLEILGSPSADATKAINMVTFPPLVASGVSRVFSNCLEHGTDQNAEIPYTTKWGKTVYLRILVTPLLDESDNVRGCQAVMEDVSESKQAQEEQAKSQQLVQALIDSSPAGIALLRKRQVQWGNKTFEELMGVSLEEAKGRDARHFYASDDEYERAGKALYPGLAKGVTRETEALLRRSDGSTFPALISLAMVDETPGDQAMVALFMDMTDRKRTEEALRESEKRYRDLVEKANDIIYRADANGFFTFFNPVGLRITDFSQEEITSKHYLDLIHPDYKKQVEKFYGIQFLKRIPDTYYEVPIITKNGKAVWIGQNVQLLLEGDTVAGFQAICRDITDRKSAEESLRRSEERLQLALQGGDLGLWDLHIPTGRAVVNQRAAEMIGYSLDEIDQSFGFWASLLHPDDRERILKSLYDYVSGLTDYSEQEYRVRHKDGNWRWIHARGKITERDPDGKPLRMTGTFLDITDRKLAESQAAEANEFREKIIAASPVGIAVYRADGQCISANEELARIVGTDRESLLAQNFRDLSSWKDSGLLSEAEQVLSGGTNNQREVQLTSTFGKHMWVSARMARLTFSGQHNLLMVMNDISERRAAEDALKFEREQLLSLFESINEVVLVIDPRTYEILFANKFTENLYGKKLIGGLCYDKLNGFDNPCHPCTSEKIIPLGGKPFQWEYSSRALHRDFLATDRMIRWPDGRDVKFQLAIDITDRKKAEEQQDHLKAQLFQAQKMEAIGTLAGGVAHDFNNLLTVIMGFSELLMDEKDQEHPEHADLEKIFHAAKNGAELVQRLLMFSRKSEPKLVPMNLNKQIVQVEKLLRRTIPKMVDIHLDLSPDLPDINADPSQVEQVLMNLAVNARDAMPDKGKLTVGTYSARLDDEYCRLQVNATPGEYVVLEVSDTGHGMDKQTVEHIFEPFFTTKERGRGTGLGLAMVYGIVKQHNGHITVYSEVGKGTTFRVYFPAVEGEAETEAATSATTPAFGTETVLLVDDEEFVRELGARILTKRGYTVLQAENGRKALDLFEKEGSRISLVILDLIMPEMGGTECLGGLLKLDPGANVLIASGFSADASVKETIQMGAKGFVGKPFRAKELLSEIRRILDED